MSQHLEVKAIRPRYDIINGPSKESLKVALFERQPRPSLVVFSALAPAPIYEVIIGSITADDEKPGERWLIVGKAYGYTDDKNRYPLGEHNVRIDYRSDTRKGRMQFI